MKGPGEQGLGEGRTRESWSAGGAEASTLAVVVPRTFVVGRRAGMDTEVTLRLRGFRHFWGGGGIPARPSDGPRGPGECPVPRLRWRGVGGGGRGHQGPASQLGCPQALTPHLCYKRLLEFPPRFI